MYAMAIGELLMIAADIIFIREVVDRGTISDVCRTLIAGGATILLMRLLPSWSPFLAIPLCIAVFAGLSFLAGAMKRSDVELLRASFRKPLPITALTGEGADPASLTVSEIVDSSDRLP
jgi:hypothetical protein